MLWMCVCYIGSEVSSLYQPIGLHLKCCVIEARKRIVIKPHLEKVSFSTIKCELSLYNTLCIVKQELNDRVCVV